MFKPTIRIRRTREVQDREDRFRMARLADLLVKKMPKLAWTYNFAHPAPFWTHGFRTEQHDLTFKLDMALLDNSPFGTPHQWRLTLLEGREPGYPVVDPLVGHEAVQRLVDALRVREIEVSTLIQNMLAELKALGT